jgi:acetyl esterase
LAGCTLVSVEYRLAPRHPHPAALRDVLTVMAWVQARLEDPDCRLVVGGDSAGGTIAACAALVWRDQRRPLAAQLLAYPPLDPRCRAASYTRHVNSFPTRAGMLAAWHAYRGASVDTGASAYSTPFETKNLRGLAPAVLGVGELDPVADDVRAYARRLRAAGNTVELREFPAMGHGSFLRFADQTTASGFLVENPLRRWLATTFRSALNPQRW